MKKMSEEEFASNIDDIARALDGKLSEEEIEEELRKYVDVYGVPLGSAKRAIVKKFEGDPEELYPGPDKSIEDIQGDERSLNLKVRIVSLDRKEVEVDNEPKTIQYGILGDESGTVPFTCWELLPEEIEERDTVRIENAYANTWNDEPQVNMGSRSSLEKIEDDEVGSCGEETQYCEIGSLREGMRKLEVVARVLSVERKTVSTDHDEEKELFSGLMADETGKVQYTAWDDFGLSEGDAVRVKRAYVKSWKGAPQLTFGESSQVDILDEDELPSAEELDRNSTMTISELAKRGGAVDVHVDAVMIDVKTSSGLIFRCPECSRVLQKGACRVHGKVDGDADLRIKGILDDGTGALTVIMNREVTEGLLGYDLDDAMEKARDKMNQHVIREELEEKLIAQPLTVLGDVTSDDYGLMMNADRVDHKMDDTREKAAEMVDEQEG